MSINLTVLTPNGRRQVVKANLNSSILQVLEDVCRKQNFNESGYGLIHLNKKLDLSSTIRYSSLPNNAKLELVKCEEASITKPNSTVTICFSTSTGERVTKQCNADQSLWEAVSSISQIPNKSDDTSEVPVCVYMRREIIGEDNLKKVTFKSLGIVEGSALIRFSFRPVDMPAEQPHVEAVNLPKVSQKVFSDRSESANDDPGVVSDMIYQPPTLEDQSNNRIEVDMENVESVDESLSQTEASVEMPSEILTNQTNEIIDSNVLDAHESQIVEEKIIYLDDRNSLLFNLDDVHTRFEDTLPDEFFDVTLADVRYLYSDHKRKIQELDESPLQTRATREAEYFVRLKKYPKAVIRINFPDRFVLQGIFKAHDTIGTVENFVRNFLIEKTMDFHLYITPPKRILQSEEILYEVPLVPTAVVLFGCNEIIDHYLTPEVISNRSSFSGANRTSSQLRGVKVQPQPVAMEEGTVRSTGLVSTPSDVPSTNLQPSASFERQQRAIHESKGAIPKWFLKGKK